MRMARLTVAALAMVVAGCGGSGPVSPPAPPPPPPPPAPVASVGLNQTAATLVPQQTLQLTATPRDAAGNTLSGRTVTWDATPPAVATVSGSGLVSAVAAGTATVTATSEGVSASATITVREGGVVGATGGTVATTNGLATVTVPAGAAASSVPISITPVTNPPADPKLIAGTAYDFGPDGTTFSQPVTLALKYDAAAAVGRTPTQFRVHKLVNNVWTLLPGGTVDVGTRTVRAPTSSFSTYAVLEIAPVASVTVTPGTGQVLVGATLALAAQPKDAGNANLSGRTVTWTSGDLTKATVSAAGVVTGVAAGTVTITATSEGISGTATIDVVSATFAPSFSKPFAGEFPTTNFLDHDIPKEFVDVNNIFTTFWGEVHPQRGGMVDGHSGYDWLMPTGTPLLAVIPGKVTRASTSNAPFFCPPLNRDVTDAHDVMIEYTLPNGDVVWAWYAHLDRIDVALNQQVAVGQQIGVSGNTGCSSAPHLHFEVYRRTPTKLITLDPYGWQGAGPDPWQNHVDGTGSIQLWKAGQAPQLWRETRNNFTASAACCALVIGKVVYQGVRDDQNPNNEYLEVALDSRAAASASLNGYRLVGDKAGLNFSFPAGLTLNAQRPTIRVYSGTGTNTATEIYLGRSTPVWSNFQDDCARLISGSGGQYRWNLGNGCPLPGSAPVGQHWLAEPVPAPREAHPPGIRVAPR